MHHSAVDIKSLTTYQDIADVIELIERDCNNVVGGFAAWNSGRETELTQSAKRTIKALERKQDKIYGKLAKENGWNEE